jgi:hypothetical protein
MYRRLSSLRMFVSGPVYGLWFLVYGFWFTVYGCAAFYPGNLRNLWIGRAVLKRTIHRLPGLHR